MYRIFGLLAAGVFLSACAPATFEGSYKGYLTKIQLKPGFTDEDSGYQEYLQNLIKQLAIHKEVREFDDKIIIARANQTYYSITFYQNQKDTYPAVDYPLKERPDGSLYMMTGSPAGEAKYLEMTITLLAGGNLREVYEDNAAIYTYVLKRFK